jgi:MFS family permease
MGETRESALQHERVLCAPAVAALAGMAALAIAMGIGRFAFTPILPMMQTDAGLSIAAGGWLASANYLGTLVGALLAMALHVRAPRAIRGGLVMIGIATFAMSLTHWFPALLMLRVFAGIATAWVLVCASAWSIEKLTPYRRPLLNSTVFAGYGVGIAVAGAACLVLMQLKASSSQAWAILGGLSIAVTAVIWPVFRPDRDAWSSEVQTARTGPAGTLTPRVSCSATARSGSATSSRLRFFP